MQCNDFIQGVDTISTKALSDLSGGSGPANEPRKPSEYYSVKYILGIIEIQIQIQIVMLHRELETISISLSSLCEVLLGF